MIRATLFLLVFPTIVACAPPRRAPSRLPEATLLASDGPRRLAEIVEPGHVTVIEFFSAECPCQTAHDDRLRQLAVAYRDRGVDVVAVDSEAGASTDRARNEALSRRYPFPILADPTGALADALGAEFATYTVVVDRRGAVRYRGGIDSDRTHVTRDASLWVRDAVDRLLVGADPDPIEAEALGCALRRR
ncbi:MAG: redoxin family protein [Byssovorax sp.]